MTLKWLSSSLWIILLVLVLVLALILVFIKGIGMIKESIMRPRLQTCRGSFSKHDDDDNDDDDNDGFE